jgi:hypothetical protein
MNRLDPTDPFSWQAAALVREEKAQRRSHRWLVAAECAFGFCIGALLVWAAWLIWP